MEKDGVRIFNKVWRRDKVFGLVWFDPLLPSYRLGHIGMVS